MSLSKKLKVIFHAYYMPQLIQINPWSMALVKKPTVVQLIMKLSVLLWNPKVYYHVHSSQSFSSNLSQTISVHLPHPKIHFNITRSNTTILKTIVESCYLATPREDIKNKEDLVCYSVL
jgi:hypothetical protein